MADNSDKPPCKYGDRCYQRNEAHLSRFSHPPKDTDNEGTSGHTVLAKRDSSHSPRTEPNTKRVRSSSSEDSESTDTGHSSATDTLECPAPCGSTPTTNEPNADELNSDEPKPEASNADRTEENKTTTHLEIIRSKFLIELPAHFLKFWDFCKIFCWEFKRAPQCLFERVFIKLVGPFDVLAGHFDECDAFDANDYLRHWRYYYDPPEFQVCHPHQKMNGKGEY